MSGLSTEMEGVDSGDSGAGFRCNRHFLQDKESGLMRLFKEEKQLVRDCHCYTALFHRSWPWVRGHALSHRSWP